MSRSRYLPVLPSPRRLAAAAQVLAVSALVTAVACGPTASPGALRDPLDLLGPARQPTPLPPPNYPLWTPTAAIPGQTGACAPTLEITPQPDYLINSASLESSRPAVDRGWALFCGGSGCSLLGASASGEPTRFPVFGTASRVQVEGDDVLLADGYATTRVVVRYHGGDPVGTWETHVPAHSSLDSFYAAPDVVGFADLMLNPTDLGASVHVLWLSDAAGAPLGRVEPGGYVAVRGRPFCRSDRCVTAGELRYVGAHAEHAWTIGADGRAEDQALSTGPVYAAATVEAGGALYDFFLAEGDLYAARWTGGGWEGLGRIDGVARFYAAADGDEPVLAWARAGETWRYSRMNAGVLGVVQDLVGTSDDDQVTLVPTADGADVAVVRLEERREVSPYPRDLRITRHLSVRLGWIDRAGTLTLSEPLEQDSEDGPHDLVVAPILLGSRAAWILQVPSVPTRLVRLQGCVGAP